MRKLLILILFLPFALSAIGQALPDSVAKFVKSFSLEPLYKVDTISKKIPADFVTSFGWHVVHYAIMGYPDAVMLNVYTLIYKDNMVFYTRSQMDWFKINYDYDSIQQVKETDKFLYFTTPSHPEELGDNLTIFSKGPDEGVYDLTFLIYKNFEENIFVELDNTGKAHDGFPKFRVTNILKDTTVIVSFENFCAASDNSKCVDGITYANGTLTITANLTKKRGGKTIKEVHSVSI